MSKEGERSSIGVSVERKLPDPIETQVTERMRLQVHTEPDSQDAAIAAIQNAGGKVLASYDTLVIADVPVANIREMAGSDAIRLVNEFVSPEPHGNPKPNIRHTDVDLKIQESSIPERNNLPQTEGREIIGADVLQEQGITGAGTTVAVLDVAPFNVDNEQYSEQVIATIGAEEGDSLFDFAYRQPGGHGDACADILSVIAPDAELILVDHRLLDGGVIEALDILETEFPEVDVVSYSVGFLPDFRIDGLDPISLRIAEFTENTNAVFVNSAGNSAAVEEAFLFDPELGPISLPQENGDAYDSKGDAVFNENNLLEFDANFTENLDFPTRLPVETFADVTSTAANGSTSNIGWIIVHWDAEPEIDDQVYEARVYQTPEADNPVETSRTANPWETIVVRSEWFEGETTVTMDVEEDTWVVKEVVGEADIAPTNEPNPRLSFPDGQRITIRNEAWDEHPLEFQDRNGETLLSQETEGRLETVDLIDWQQDNEEVAFTITSDLSAELASYVSTKDEGRIAGSAESAQALPIYVEVEEIDADENHHFDVWGQFDNVNIPTPFATDERTVGIPALSQDSSLLSVGAVQAVDLGDAEGQANTAFNLTSGELKSYSSQGPTQDGRRGIDLAGPSNVSTNARGAVDKIPLGALAFNGTSAAAPHIAGAASLLYQAASETLFTQETESELLSPGEADEVTATVGAEVITSPGEYVINVITNDDEIQGHLTVNE
ncbi:S8 family serine peptidase [Salinarchaeum sp. IM2453]|uniref:S8 family serine peptidase n=1 Tax=Salinarchaeum sp. IM2453 TaxID=2862870 RepID=UPI001C82AE4B|nr:S8 family serine peptidase [Salinarchaeum sp. IM2453]QZA88414.1 S8 family serine peptidase [Salinarchaeum sp. IM2453]